MNINNNRNKLEYNKNKVNYLVSQYVKSHKGETQESVAAQIGVSKSTLYGGNPTAENLTKICLFFGIEPNELFIFLKKNTPVKREDIVASPIAEYNTSLSPENLYKIMYEQQVELTVANKRIGELELECERLKNANAPMNGAKAG